MILKLWNRISEQPLNFKYLASIREDSIYNVNFSIFGLASLPSLIMAKSFDPDDCWPKSKSPASLAPCMCIPRKKTLVERKSAP